MIVTFTAMAESELEAIGDHIACDDPARAISFLAELQERCLSLSQMPRRFPLVPRYAAEGVRHLGHGHYLIFYRIDEATVTILHVLHGARDYDAIMTG